jgi:hypothetical protein
MKAQNTSFPFARKFSLQKFGRHTFYASEVKMFLANHTICDVSNYLVNPFPVLLTDNSQQSDKS